MTRVLVALLLLAGCGGPRFDALEVASDAGADAQAPEWAPEASPPEPPGPEAGAGPSRPVEPPAMDAGGARVVPDGAAPCTVPPSSTWAVEATGGGLEPPANAIDGDPTTRWQIGPTQGGEWLEVAFPRAVTVGRVLVHAVFETGEGWRIEADGHVVAEGAGSDAVPPLEIVLDPVVLERLRLTQTGAAAGSFFNLYELEVFCP